MPNRQFVGNVVGRCALAAVMLGSLGAAAQAAESYKVIYTFKGGSDGSNPYAGVTRDSAGNFYTATGGGGSSNAGTVIKLTAAGTESVLYTFKGGSDGANPYGNLLVDSTADLFGTAFAGGVASGSSGLGTVFKIASTGAESLLHTFTFGNDGGNPQAGLLLYKGSYYTTTLEGGAYGYGAVVKVTPSGTESIVYAFHGGSDGANPYAGVIADSAGNLYGTTEQGGATGNGTIFKIAPGGTETILHSFQGGSDGANPYGGLAVDHAGNFYGTTFGGGSTGCGGMGCGTVFELTTGGTESVIYAFKGGSDGMFPEAGLAKDITGNFYGTTFQGGGTSCGGSGCGTLFEISTGHVETILHAFTGVKDGAFPNSGVLVIGDSELVGTTIGGGSYSAGTIYKLTNW